MLNRLNVRLLVAFSTILIVTLCIMWVALLLVLRAQPPNTDSEAIDLSALLLETSGQVLERYNVSLNEARQIEAEATEDGTFRDRLGNRVQTFDSILRGTLEEQAALNDVRFMVLRGNDCIIWDTPGYQDYPRVLDQNNRTSAPLLRTERQSQLETGQFLDAEETWLYVALPRATNLDELVPDSVATIVNRNADVTCGESADPSSISISIIAAEPYPEHTVASILEEYEGDGIFLALIQAVIIGLFFALLTSYLIVRWVSRPLKEVSATAAAIADGNYSQRANLHGPIEIQTMAGSFNQMAQQVEANQQAQRDFLANVSHDLRTPLTSIQGFAQAIAEGVAEGESAQHSATIIESEAGRMNRMVNDLLEIAKIQAGRLEMLRNSIDLQRILQTVGHSLTMKATQKGLDFGFEVDPLPIIAGDGDRLSQVFTNLVDNAIKHTDAGGIVRLRAARVEDGIHVYVQDTGEGIPSEDLPRIFERFYQVDKSRTKRQGTGLGLAISFEIIEAHGGRIWAESSVGEGTVFHVWLPQPSYDPGDTVIRPRL